MTTNTTTNTTTLDPDVQAELQDAQEWVTTWAGKRTAAERAVHDAAVRLATAWSKVPAPMAASTHPADVAAVETIVADARESYRCAETHLGAVGRELARCRANQDDLIRRHRIGS
jgi:hypothetical protein